MSNTLQQSISVFNGEELQYSNESDYVTVTVTMIKTILKLLTGKTSSIPAYLGYGSKTTDDVGESTTNATPRDTKLLKEFTDSKYSRIKLYNYSTYFPESTTGNVEGQLSLVFVDDSNNEWPSIAELGVFLEQSGSNLVAVYNPQTALVKLQSKSLVVEWTIRFSIPVTTT